MIINNIYSFDVSFYYVSCYFMFLFMWLTCAMLPFMCGLLMPSYLMLLFHAFISWFYFMVCYKKQTNNYLITNYSLNLYINKTITCHNVTNTNYTNQYTIQTLGILNTDKIKHITLNKLTS